MKYSIYQKLKIAGATLLASAAALFSPSDGRANEIVLDRSNSEELGLSFDKILTTLETAGATADESGVILAGVYEEEKEVELQSLEGISVRIPVARIASGDFNTPPNMEEVIEHGR